MAHNPPHFLLVSETRSPHADDARGGSWRILLAPARGGRHFEAHDHEPEARGERLELLAVVRGLEALDQPSRVTLVTRSRYVQRGLRYGLPQWREAGWLWEHFGELAPVKDEDLWRRIDRALRFHQVDCRGWPAAETRDTPRRTQAHTPPPHSDSPAAPPARKPRRFRLDAPHAPGRAATRPPASERATVEFQQNSTSSPPPPDDENKPAQPPWWTPASHWLHRLTG